MIPWRPALKTQAFAPLQPGGELWDGNLSVAFQRQLFFVGEHTQAEGSANKKARCLLCLSQKIGTMRKQINLSVLSRISDIYLSSAAHFLRVNFVHIVLWFPLVLNDSCSVQTGQAWKKTAQVPNQRWKDFLEARLWPCVEILTSGYWNCWFDIQGCIELVIAGVKTLTLTDRSRWFCRLEVTFFSLCSIQMSWKIWASRLSQTNRFLNLSAFADISFQGLMTEPQDHTNKGPNLFWAKPRFWEICFVSPAVDYT